ncbi:hypothetical protein B296_00025861 [Ensete ventricosum]|uniref:Uncharacterized protein n=1 Tax=Ensete ventricosum TaxID=4639 RepID=A0A426YQ47_ENSVE|nr:hypothetical protein B296_00025861 [Ensete ventricosum]
MGRQQRLMGSDKALQWMPSGSRGWQWQEYDSGPRLAAEDLRWCSLLARDADSKEGRDNGGEEEWQLLLQVAVKRRLRQRRLRLREISAGCNRSLLVALCSERSLLVMTKSLLAASKVDSSERSLLAATKADGDERSLLEALSAGPINDASSPRAGERGVALFLRGERRHRLVPCGEGGVASSCARKEASPRLAWGDEASPHPAWGRRCRLIQRGETRRRLVLHGKTRRRLVLRGETRHRLVPRGERRRRLFPCEEGGIASSLHWETPVSVVSPGSGRSTYWFLLAKLVDTLW